DAPEIFQQSQPEHDGHGPQLADRKLTYFLIRCYEAAETLYVDVTIAVRNDLDGDVIYPGIPGEYPAAKFWKTFTVSFRQVSLAGAYLFFDEIEVIEQPFTGRCDRFFFPYCILEEGGDAIKYLFVIGEAFK